MQIKSAEERSFPVLYRGGRYILSAIILSLLFQRCDNVHYQLLEYLLILLLDYFTKNNKTHVGTTYILILTDLIHSNPFYTTDGCKLDDCMISRWCLSMFFTLKEHTMIIPFPPNQFIIFNKTSACVVHTFTRIDHSCSIAH